MKYGPVAIKSVNYNRIANWHPVGKYNAAFNSCVTQTSLALNTSGAFNLFSYHPYILHFQMALRSVGFRPALLTYHLY